MFDNIIEESDAFPAELSPDDLRDSRYFSTLSRIGSFPLLSGKTVSALIEYTSRVRSKRRGQGEEWDIDTYTKILRLLEQVMREGDDLPSFQEVRKPDIASKGKKSKKGSKSPDLNDKPLEPAAESAEQIQHRHSELAIFGAAGSAAACALSMLDQQGLPKQVG